MKRSIFALITLVLSIFLIACGEPAGNTANRAANTANTGNAANTANANSAAANPAAAEAEVRKLMDTAQAALAKNDADAMEKIYADNYMLVNTDGTVQNKAERVAALRSGDAKYTAFAYSEPNIRVSPDGMHAVVIAKLAMKGTFRGKPNDGDFRVTQVYSKGKDGQWKQITAQATKVDATAAPAKAAANAPANSAPAANSAANK